jgi:hypothetical protein
MELSPVKRGQDIIRHLENEIHFQRRAGLHGPGKQSQENNRWHTIKDSS